MSPRRITAPIRRALTAKHAVEWATGPARRQRYHPDAPQKGPLQIAVDNVAWALRHGEVNDGYFLLGLDAVGAERSPLHRKRHLMNLIEAQIAARGAQSLRSLLKDKYLFGLVAQALDYPSPRNLALLTPAGVTALSPRRTIGYDEVADFGPGLRGFCKPVGGQGGAGAFLLDAGAGRLVVDGQRVGPDDLRARVGTRYVVQERVEQHPDMAALHPSSVNTLRLTTAHVDGRAHLFSAVVRVGTGGSIVDNWSSGGLLLYADPASGRLGGRALYKLGMAPGGSGVAVRSHPDTGVEFDGYSVPMFEEAVDLVVRFHDDLGPLVMVAWDVAVTPTGPTVVEGNTHPDGRAMMALDPTYHDRYRALVERSQGE